VFNILNIFMQSQYTYIFKNIWLFYATSW